MSEANRLLTSAEVGGDARLRARAGMVGDWEIFSVSATPGGHTTSIKSVANRKFVSAELGYGGNDRGLLRARADSMGSWESFTW